MRLLNARHSRFPEHWRVLPFTSLVKDATSGNTKIARQDYLESGKYPIVDQGQALYGGYTNQAEDICKSELPTIIFGDHTRVFKYIEEPFAVGADGVKVLEPFNELLDKKFLFHYLKQLKIESAGYSRHFKFLKETFIPLPPLFEQQRIAAILDKADSIRQKRQQAIKLADDFLRSVFLDMFGDIPAGISPYPLKGCRGAVNASSGKSSKAVISEEPTQIPIYGGNGINGFASKALYDEPVIVVGRVGQQCAITHITTGPSWVTDNAIVINVTNRNTFNPIYLAYAFMHSPIREAVTRLDLPFINQQMLLDYPIPHAPITLQIKFANIRMQVLDLMDRFNSSNDLLNCNFEALSLKAFSGQL